MSMMWSVVVVLLVGTSVLVPAASDGCVVDEMPVMQDFDMQKVCSIKLDMLALF